MAVRHPAGPIPGGGPNPPGGAMVTFRPSRMLSMSNVPTCSTSQASNQRRPNAKNSSADNCRSSFVSPCITNTGAMNMPGPNAPGPIGPPGPGGAKGPPTAPGIPGGPHPRAARIHRQASVHQGIGPPPGIGTTRHRSTEGWGATLRLHRFPLLGSEFQMHGPDLRSVKELVGRWR